MVRRLRYHFPDSEATQFTADRVSQFLQACRIDAGGFGERERRYLAFLSREGSASLGSLAMVVGADEAFVLRHVEQPLRHRGLVTISHSGRKLSAAGAQWIREQSDTWNTEPWE
jgi:Holliday junction resolvasome RuvABC ATP-dependent DNA helicase subunit